MTRPTMRFVSIKSAEQQAAGMLLKTRELLVRQRTQTANALRAHMAEFGFAVAKGMASLEKLTEAIRDPERRTIPEIAKRALLELVEQIDVLSARIDGLDVEIRSSVQADEVARRLMTIPGVGRSAPPPYAQTCMTPPGSRAGETSPLGSASRRAHIPAEAKSGWVQFPSAETCNSGHC